MKQVSHELRRTAMLLPSGAGVADGCLLERFISQRDDVAFEALVRRHGAMVLGVCQRVTGHSHDAEDAFQAAFLVLARKAAAVRPRELLGNWLYGVALRSALEARTRALRRRSREQPLDDMPDSLSPDHREACAVLDQELSKLPDKYRSAIVLCELEGRPRREAADSLGIPLGTLASRLAYARKLLARRLTQRGVVLPMTGLVALGVGNKASAGLVATTVRTCMHYSTGGMLAGVGSTSVLTITEGVMKTMLLAKLRNVALRITASLCLVGLGAWGVLAADRPGADLPVQTASKAPPPGKAPDDPTKQEQDMTAPDMGVATAKTAKHPKASKVLDAMEGFRKKLPDDTRGLFAGTGMVYKGLEPYTMPHLLQVAEGLGVSTQKECLMLLTYVKDADLKLRFIAIHAIDKATNAYPGGMSIECITDPGSESHRQMLFRFLELIDKLPA